jgi:hypothetical protein
MPLQTNETTRAGVAFDVLAVAGSVILMEELLVGRDNVLKF